MPERFAAQLVAVSGSRPRVGRSRRLGPAGGVSRSTSARNPGKLKPRLDCHGTALQPIAGAPLPPGFQTLQSVRSALSTRGRQLAIAGKVTARLRAVTERYVMTFLVAATFAGSLDRRYGNLCSDLEFQKRFRIPRITALFDPSPQRPFALADLPRVFADFYPAEER